MFLKRMVLKVAIIVTPRTLLIVGALIIAALILVAAYTAIAGVKVENARYTESPKAVGVFMTIKNYKLTQTCVIGAIVLEQARVTVELHETIYEEGAYKMKHVEKLCISPLGSLELRPAGPHIMIMGGHEELVKLTKDGIIRLNLILDDGSKVYVEAKPAEISGGHGHG